jgi:hypothetical protein
MRPCNSKNPRQHWGVLQESGSNKDAVQQWQIQVVHTYSFREGEGPWDMRLW